MDAAQSASPPDKEQARKAFRREGADDVPPGSISFSTDVIVRYGDGLADLLCEFPDDVVSVLAY